MIVYINITLTNNNNKFELYYRSRSPTRHYAEPKNKNQQTSLNSIYCKLSVHLCLLAL